MEKYSPYSDLKVFYHTDRINGMIRGDRVAPVYVRIKPTNICNQNCFYCGYANNRVFENREVDRRESIPWEILKRTISELAEMNVKALTFSGGGDPLIYHSIEQALELVHYLGIDYSMITNGQALEGNVVDYLKYAKWVRVSLDASDQKTYEKIRGIKTFDKVITNIGDFARQKSDDCILGINCVISKQNAQEIFEICKLVKSLGVDNIKLDCIRVKTEDMADYHENIKNDVCQQIAQAKGMLEDETFKIVDKYSNDIELDSIYEKKYTKCYMQNLFTVIAADSKVYRCHQRAYMKSGEIGDLAKSSFKEIWYSQETINNANNFKPQEECGFRCAFDGRNELLSEFMNMDRNHVNFV